MAKTCSTAVLDAALGVITAGVTRICVCKGAPPTATAAESSAANGLGNTTCTVGGGGLTLGVSSVTGKKIDVSAFNGIAAISTGVADHVCLISTGATGVIYYQTVCSTQAITSTANTINIPAWIIRISDAT
jgi:hypothetical protein